jgi:hypothetical protein
MIGEDNIQIAIVVQVIDRHPAAVRLEHPHVVTAGNSRYVIENMFDKTTRAKRF